MNIKKVGTAGTLESSDIMITIEQHHQAENIIMLKSSVEKQFGGQIRCLIAETLCETGLTGVRVTAVDKGALDCTIRARLLTAVHRACAEEHYNWG